MLKFTVCLNGEGYCSFERSNTKEAIELTKRIIEEDQLIPEEVTLYYFESDEMISLDEAETSESNTKNYNNLEEALNGLRTFQTYRLESNAEEREIIENAMLKVGIDPMQITELIRALQKEV